MPRRIPFILPALLAAPFASCRRPAPAPPVAAGQDVPEAPEAAERGDVVGAAGTAAGEGDASDASDVPAPPGWSVFYAPDRGPRLSDAAALDAERVIAVGDDVLYRRAGDRWEAVAIDDARALEVAAADGVLWVRIEDRIVDVPRYPSLRSADARAFLPAPAPDDVWTADQVPPDAAPPAACAELPPHFAPVVTGRDGEGRIVALGPHRAGGVCPIEQYEMVHRDFDGGGRGYFQEPRGGGWEWIPGPRNNPLPREPLAVLPTAPALAVGREGSLATIACTRTDCTAEGLIRVAFPRVLDLLALDDGSLLLALDDRVLRLTQGAAETVALDAEGARWLVEAERPGVWGFHPVRSAALAGGTAVLVVTGQLRGLWVSGTTGSGFALDREPLGVARAGQGEAVILLNGGRVVRGTPDRWSDVGDLETLPPEGVSHAFGVYAGRDGVVRLLDPRRPLACAIADRLEPCGDVVTTNEREVFPLRDGLVIETQEIGIDLADERGVRAITDLGTWNRIDYAGTVDRIHALTEVHEGEEVRREVRRLEADAWSTVAEVPGDPLPQALEVSPDGAVHVAAEGGVVFSRGAEGRRP